LLWPRLDPTGHHAGLADWTPQLQTKLRDKTFLQDALLLTTRARADCSRLDSAVSGLANQRDFSPTSGKRRFDLFVRMLFSCLVDANRLDSGRHVPFQRELLAEERLDALLRHLNGLQQRAPDGIVKEMRAKVLESCLRAASLKERLFSLSVPTGGGKTLAAMAFALRRAVKFPGLFRRVIVVIPYLSIIEQNAKVYSDIFGQDALLEHHSGSIAKLAKCDEDHFIPGRKKRTKSRSTFKRRDCALRRKTGMRR
jgi:CRISPR-associated endonuclease/helicase Cas3